ncbi:putative exonuclease GOR [Leptinotarsa decemlineata]|uniref:putative exonuclease GOR n=1 Tax=Leptinotarsa decemlineata TaxID=7539 RepID=UPI003D304DE2
MFNRIELKDSLSGKEIFREVYIPRTMRPFVADANQLTYNYPYPAESQVFVPHFQTSNSNYHKQYSVKLTSPSLRRPSSYLVDRPTKRTGPLAYSIAFDVSAETFMALLPKYLVPQDCLRSLGYPSESILLGNVTSKWEEQSHPPGEKVYVKTCSRCKRIFHVAADYYITREKCCHHWGKLKKINKNGLLSYECCGQEKGSKGCTESGFHVWSGPSNGISDAGYVSTKRNPMMNIFSYKDAYAVDCEMCYTVKGLELTKVTVVGMDGSVVYDSYVKPDHEIVDYNTRFSGITAQHMAMKNTRNIRQVQRDLMKFIHEGTILIGHALDNDLRALKLVHQNIVDTAHVFPHKNGLPCRRSLKDLTATILNRNIQIGAIGHDSYEDAVACLQLMFWKVKADFHI